MDALPPALQDELAGLLASLDGLERTRYLCIATTCAVVYDIFLTFDQEFEFFWKPGPWSISRVLFFLNRYFPLVTLACVLLGDSSSTNASRRSCIGLVHTNFFFSVIGLAIVQGEYTHGCVPIIVLRICYVYSKEFVTRAFIVGCFVACSIITLAIYGKIWHDVDSVPIPVPGLKIDGCTAPPSRQIWKMFIPNLGLHTLLYLATTLPMLRMRRVGKQSHLLDRLARDGGIFYFNVFALHMYCVQRPVAYRAYSSLLLGVASMSVSRLMLSIRSLAARLSVSEHWLLNNTELSRVNWKPGRNGELIVEIEAIEDDVELKSVDEDTKRSATPAIYTTRVGVLNHPVYPGTRDYKAPPRQKKTKVTFKAGECSDCL
ncbi:hypothetical protein GY45DRAFT_1256521 [Cubamyces sp. BRFM 1775]|nr:hypothetical protein GY45DRAFT_1256521 [Cubamyces sp. BRFM 1775]